MIGEMLAVVGYYSVTSSLYSRSEMNGVNATLLQSFSRSSAGLHCCLVTGMGCGISAISWKFHYQSELIMYSPVNHNVMLVLRKEVLNWQTYIRKLTHLHTPRLLESSC